MRRVLTTTIAVVLLLSPLLLVLALRVRNQLRSPPRGDDVGLARRELLGGDATTAETRLRRHLRDDPADARAWQLLAESLRAQRRSAESVRASRRAADLAPGWDAPAVSLAAAAVAEDRDEEAAYTLERALTAGGATRLLLRARSLLHARAGRFGAAADDLERAALRKGGGAPELVDAARHRRTEAFVADTDDASAGDLLRHALTLADDEAAPGIRRELEAPRRDSARPATQVVEARRAAHSGLGELARAHLREALLARPDDPDIAFALGMRLGLAHAVDDAVDLADRLPGGDAGTAAQRLLGWFHVGCGEWDRADGLLLERRRDPERARRVITALETARVEGVRVATESAVAAVANTPDKSLPRLVLGMAAEHQGDLPEAMRHYAAALAREPSLGLAANDLAWQLRVSPDTRPAARRLAAWARYLSPTDEHVAHTEAVIRTLSSRPTSERNDR